MSSELRELLGKATISSSDLRELGTKAKVSEKRNTIDIKDDFFNACKELKMGEVAFMPGFRLNDAMSAVELMDPKMDIGLERYIRKPGVEQLRSMNFFANVSFQEVLTIYDATLACFVSFLEGGNIANTLYSNVLLSEPFDIEHPALSCLAQLFTYIVSMIRTVVHTAMVYEEEDFNGGIPYSVMPVEPADIFLEKVKIFETELLSSATADNANIVKAIISRISWLRILMEYFIMVIPPMRVEDEQINGKGFRPMLEIAEGLADHLKCLSLEFTNSWKLGVPAPETGDGKFEWIDVVFQPDYNKIHLTGSFPRKTLIPSREYSMNFLHKLSCRLFRIASESEESSTEFLKLLKFFKDFGLDNSCVLSRSLLQLTMFPHDEMVLGKVSLSSLIDLSVKKIVRPLVVDEKSPAYADEECRAAYTDYLDEITKATLAMVSHFGMNLARQREKLSNSIDELIIIQGLAEHLDARSNDLMRDVHIEGHPQHPIIGFAYNLLVHLISYYIELSFKLDLFAPYEYAHFFWYYGEVLCRYNMNALERMLEVTYYEYRTEFEKIAAKNKKKTAKRLKAEEDVKLRIEQSHSQKLKLIGEAALALGVSRATIGLIKWGKIKIPRWDIHTDQIHFQHRISAFKLLGPPLYLDYEQYLGLSKFNENLACEPAEMFRQAIESFELAKNHFKKLIERTGNAPEVEALEKLCKNNIVVLRLLSSGRMDSKKAEWVISDGTFFPLLRMS